MRSSPGTGAHSGSGALAIAFEDVFRIPVKLRAGLAPDDLQFFRASVDEAIKIAGRSAESLGYERERVGKATYAVVALVDESVLNAPHPALRDWAKHTLQESYWGDYTAGETFYRLLDELLTEADSSGLADILEVFQLAMLLGFRGRYGDAEGELRSLVDAVQEKIDRCRGGGGVFAPGARLPREEVPAKQADPWVRRLAIAGLATAGTAIVFFALLSLLLRGAVAETLRLGQGVIG